MDEQNRVRYPLGSRRRWLTSLVLLFLPFAIMYLALRVALPALATLLLLIQIPIWVALLSVGIDSKLSSRREWHVPWFSNINANLAFGSAEEDGIYFQKWFRRSFVRWRGVERLEYWPERGGRIELHLFNRWSPVVFTLEREGPETVDYISRKLEDAWPGRSTFLISFENPPGKDSGFASNILSALGVGRNVFFMLLTMFGVYGYYVIRFRLGFYSVGAALWTWSILLIMVVGEKLLRKRRSDTKLKKGTASPEPARRLRD